MKVLHLSENYLVVDKPYDVVINKTDAQEGADVTVHLMLRSRFPHLCDDRVQFGFRFAHRLDYATSGALCVALNREAAKGAMNAFQTFRTQKYYLALVRGHVRWSATLMTGVLETDSWIGEDSRPEFAHCMCTSDSLNCVNPKRALTRFLVLQRGLYDERPATKLLVCPVTGRRHQIRLHCHSLGHTIVGDYTYSSRQDTEPHRMFLHAYRLTIPTPTEVIDVTTVDPFVEEDATNKWTPTETIHKLDDPVVFTMLNCSK